MGTEAVWVPAVISAVGALGGAANQKIAQDKQQKDEVAALQHQEADRSKAQGQVSALTRQIAASTPQKTQAQATGDYVSQLRRNAAGTGQTSANSALAPAVGASSRYNTGVANSQNAVSAFGNTQAGQMGSIDAAVRQRQNEGLALNTLGTDLNTINAQSYGTNFVDQLRAQSDSQPNPWVSLGTNLLQAGARNYTSNPTPKPAAVKFPGSIAA